MKVIENKSNPSEKGLVFQYRLTTLTFRSFAKPPKPVQTVLECVVVIRGIKDVSWKSAKGMMAEGNFLKTLTEMDVDSIGGGQVRKNVNDIFY